MSTWPPAMNMCLKSFSSMAIVAIVTPALTDSPPWRRPSAFVELVYVLQPLMEFGVQWKSVAMAVAAFSQVFPCSDTLAVVAHPICVTRHPGHANRIFISRLRLRKRRDGTPSGWHLCFTVPTFLFRVPVPAPLRHRGPLLDLTRGLLPHHVALPLVASNAVYVARNLEPHLISIDDEVGLV